jgi:putative ABC transport system permease protein
MLPKPPKYAYQFLKWFCAEGIFEEIEGDLFETFLKDIDKEGIVNARKNYTLGVFHFFRPFAIKNKLINENSHTYAMYKNYILVAIRNLRKKVGYSVINIMGLAVGIACCLMILLYVKYEMSYENFQIDTEDTYRIALKRIYPDREVDYAVIPHSFGPQYVEDFPEVIAQARVSPPFGNTVFQYGDKFFDEPNVIIADSTLFDIFTIPLVAGNPKTALKGNTSIVLTESMAKKYFGDDDPMGKMLISFFGSLQVTGVAKDYPDNSHFDFDFIVPFNSVPFPFFRTKNFTGFSVISYIKLGPDSDPALLESKIPAMVKKYAEGEIQGRTGASYDEYVASGNGYHYTLQPFDDIHLHSNLEGELKPNGNYSYVLIFMAVAAFILLIACINFMNLATARSTERAKEVGIRKVLGSIKNQLVFQFLTESMLMSLISFAFSLGIVFLALPYFSNIAAIDLSMDMLFTSQIVVGMVIGIIFIGIVAGIYPAFVLSNFKPAIVLKGKMQTSGKGILLRNGLVIFQFAISIILISGTLIIYDQMNFLMNKDLGFDKERILVIDNGGVLAEKRGVFLNEVIKQNDVVNAGFSSTIPGQVYPGFVARIPGGDKESYVARQLVTDDNMLQTMGVRLKMGRFFSKDFNDTLSIIVNESSVTKLGIVDPIGKSLMQVQNDPTQNITYKIVGVIEDYHFHTLHRSIEPQVITYGNPNQANAFLRYAGVKIASDNVQKTIADIEVKWQQFAPGNPFKFFFLEEHLDRYYEAEQRSGNIFTIFTSLAIIIACIGLFSLSAYTASQKRKEIGVRKVMGASIFNIVFLLSKDFTKLILVALVFAIPVSYFWMDRWLEDFAYRVNMDYTSFLLAGIIAILIGWITVSYQSIRAAVVNPTESLRNE